jgi:hypothetical protein
MTRRNRVAVVGSVVRTDASAAVWVAKDGGGGGVSAVRGDGKDAAVCTAPPL